jgi:hypothetical protein
MIRPINIDMFPCSGVLYMKREEYNFFMPLLYLSTACMDALYYNILTKDECFHCYTVVMVFY